MPDSFEHNTLTVAVRMPNGALASLARSLDPHHRVAIADLVPCRHQYAHARTTRARSPGGQAILPGSGVNGRRRLEIGVAEPCSGVRRPARALSSIRTTSALTALSCITFRTAHSGSGAIGQVEGLYFQRSCPSYATALPAAL